MDPERIPEEFDIEDIIREFSDPDPELGDIVRQFAPEPAQQKMPVQPATGDTIRVELPRRTENASAMRRSTAVFTAIAADEPELGDDISEQMPPAEPETEPFSDDWEPEYEEPMGEYEPRGPIPFPSKNRRLRLRQKLAAGPERRFHQLAAMGVGGLQAGLFLHVLLFMFACVSTILLEAHKISPDFVQPALFAQLVAILLSGLIGCYRLLGGLGSLLRRRFHLNTLLLVTFAACCTDAFLCLNDGRTSFSALFCLEMLMAQWAAYEERITEMGQMDALRKAQDLTGVVKIDEFYDGRPGYGAVPGEPEAFLSHYALPSAPEKALCRYGLVALAVSTVLAVWTGFRFGVPTGIQTFAAALLMAMPATAFISMSRPAAIAQKHLHDLGAVLCGWQGICHAQRQAVYPLTTEDLFPADAIKLSGVKFCGTEDTGRVVSYATALIAANGCGLLSAFEHLPRGRDGWNHTVEELTVYPGGIFGLVNGIPTMLGTAEFLADMDIAIADSVRVADAVYSVMDGQLSAVFAVSYNATASAVAGLRNLCGRNSVTPVLVSSDFLLTPRFISQKLGVRLRRMEFPDRQIRQVLSEIEPESDAPVIALTTKPGLSAKVCALNAAHALRAALSAGANIHILAGILGLTVATILSVLGAAAMLTPMNLLLYSAVWIIPGWLATEWTRWA